MARFFIKRGDRLPKLELACLRADPLNPRIQVPADLTGCTAAFHMKSAYAIIAAVPKAAVVMSPATAGIVQYAWDADDTATAGDFFAEIEVLHPGGFRETFPNDDHIQVVITDSLD